jgi:hypothetical protein
MWRRKAETASGSDAISGAYLTKVINQHAARDALFTTDDGTGQRAVLEEALSCFDQAAAIRLCDESLAQLAGTSLSNPNARLAASS